MKTNVSCVENGTPEVDRMFPNWSRNAERPDFDMDDGPDLPVFNKPIGEAITFLQTHVWPAFNAANKTAMKHQRLHRRLTEVAAVSGALAGLFTVVQIVFPLPVHWHWVGGAEICVAVLALLVVVFGVRASIQLNWLLERFRAERLRQLKFAVLTHEDLWCNRFAEWQAYVLQEIQVIQKMDRKAMETWIVQERVRVPKNELAGFVLGVEPLRVFAGFYIAKRLGCQMNYFERRSLRLGGQNRRLRYWPAWCFYGSITAIALHYLLDIYLLQGEATEWLSRFFVLAALALPMIGACIRTVQVAREFGRSAALFSAKHVALQDMFQRLLGELATEPVRPAEVLHNITACEDFLEAEQREWLRLMQEAEWFG